ncbi:hypothetical protein ISN44_As10g025230, partial [Arabidopsis suecica]
IAWRPDYRVRLDGSSHSEHGTDKFQAKPYGEGKITRSL